MVRWNTLKNLSITFLALNPLAWALASDKEAKMDLTESKCSRFGGGAAPASPWSSLIGLMFKGDAARFKEALKAHKAKSVDLSKVVDGFGLGLLHMAASLGQGEMVKALVDEGCSPNQLGGQKAVGTPLHSAVKRCRAEGENKDSELKLIRYLVEDGKADLTIRDSAGHTALDIALDQASPEVVQYLLSRMDAKA